VIGQSMTSFISKNGHADFLAAHGAVIGGTPMKLELELVAIQGARRWLSAHSVPLDYKGTAVHLAVIRDISERKEMELNLKRSNAELEQFAYVASHDLRQPLRMISSYLTLLERGLCERLSEEEKTFLGFAVDGAVRMDRMITDLLSYSKICRDMDDIKPVALTDMVVRAIGNLQLSITESGASVTTDGDLPVVVGFETELERLFQNLIGNALKFQAKDSVPKVVIHCQDMATEWVIAVSDNGIGIAPEYQGRLFQIFQRLVTHDQYQGTGIGLAACRKIVENHGGHIWVESKPGEGSTFLLTIPKADRARV
jgi:light-regulated signal transduction histidine kinase (bacteriophytochrome)